MTGRRTGGFMALLLLIALLSGCASRGASILLPDDPLDPLAETVAPLPFEALRDRPLMQRAANSEGLLFLSDSQAGLLAAAGARLAMLLEKPCHAVIAVNRSRADAHISGYRQLLDSDMSVAMPHYDSDAGKALVAALASAFGADDGDLRAGYDYLAGLYAEGRLLIPTAEDRETLTARFAGGADAVLLWDYQARTLMETGDWEIVLPEEGAFRARRFLAAREARALPEALEERLAGEGWQAPTAPVLSASDAFVRAMASFKSDFRRGVLGGPYRYATASVTEKFVANALIALAMIVLATWTSLRIRNRAPLKPYLALMGGMILWLILVQVKLVAWRDEAIVALWYATYPCMLFSAMAWYALCRALRHPDGLTRSQVWRMGALFVLACTPVATNSLHGQVFRFSGAGHVFWYNNYSYGWGYWAFFAMAAFFLAAGVVEYARYASERRRCVQFAAFLCGLAMILALNLLNVFRLRLGVLLDVTWQTNLLASLTVLGASRAGFLDPAFPWRTMIDRLHLAVAIRKNGDVLFQSAAYRVLEPDLPGGGEAADAEPFGFGGRWYRKIEREYDGCQMLLWEDVTDRRAARQALLEAQALAVRNQRLAEERLMRARALLKRLSAVAEGHMLRRALRDGLRALRDVLARLEENPGNALAARRAKLLAGHCGRALRLALMDMESRTVSGKALGALFKDACLEAQLCGVDAAISCRVDGEAGACETAALSASLFALLDACLERPESAGASFRVLGQRGHLRMVALLSAAIDPGAALMVADGFAATVSRETDEQTLVLKFDFAEGG